MEEDIQTSLLGNVAIIEVKHTIDEKSIEGILKAALVVVGVLSTVKLIGYLLFANKKA